MSSLPSELLFYIFVHFREPWIPDDSPFASMAVDRGHQTLASVCLASRTFRDIAQPFLYRQFRMRTRAGGSQGDALAEWNRQLGCFMRTITERPDLAALVRRVTVNAYSAFSGAKQYACWTHPLMAVAHVADRLPNLEQYSVDLCGQLSLSESHYGIVFHGLIPLVTDIITFFDILRETGAKKAWREARIPTLNLRTPNGMGRRPGVGLVPSSKLRIDTLRIIDSEMWLGELDELLANYVGLRTFVYTAIRPTTTQLAELQGWNPHSDPEQFEIALKPYRYTLETLHLDLRYGMYNPKFRPRAVSSLKHFASLKKLLIDSKAVCPHRERHYDSGSPLNMRQRLCQMLPASLVSLQLVGCPGNALPTLGEMFLALAEAVGEGRFRALKHIACSARSVFTRVLNQTFDNLALAPGFAKVGVEFTYDAPLWDHRTFDLHGDWMRTNGTLDPEDERPWTYLWEF